MHNCAIRHFATYRVIIVRYLSWIQEGFKGCFLQKHLNPIRVPFLGDSVRILGGCPTVVTPTFGL